MDFKLTAPCASCPFLRGTQREPYPDGPVRLNADRIEEITGFLLQHNGRTFSCHKTVAGDDEPRHAGEQHCAGALILAYKTRSPVAQYTRIAERTGAIRFDELMAHEADVFDDVDEMLTYALPSRRRA